MLLYAGFLVIVLLRVLSATFLTRPMTFHPSYDTAFSLQLSSYQKHVLVSLVYPVR